MGTRSRARGRRSRGVPRGFPLPSRAKGTQPRVAPVGDRATWFPRSRCSSYKASRVFAVGCRSETPGSWPRTFLCRQRQDKPQGTRGDSASGVGCALSPGRRFSTRGFCPERKTLESQRPPLCQKPGAAAASWPPSADGVWPPSRLLVVRKRPRFHKKHEEKKRKRRAREGEFRCFSHAFGMRSLF